MILFPIFKYQSLIDSIGKKKYHSLNLYILIYNIFTIIAYNCLYINTYISCTIFFLAALFTSLFDSYCYSIFCDYRNYFKNFAGVRIYKYDFDATLILFQAIIRFGILFYGINLGFNAVYIIVALTAFHSLKHITMDVASKFEINYVHQLSLNMIDDIIIYGLTIFLRTIFGN